MRAAVRIQEPVRHHGRAEQKPIHIRQLVRKLGHVPTNLGQHRLSLTLALREEVGCEGIICLHHVVVTSLMLFEYHTTFQ